jgi:hypothetical protein
MHSSKTSDQFFFLFKIFFRQLRVCYFVTPSLTRGRVCNLLYNSFWALPEQSLLGRSPAELNGHNLLSHLRLSQHRGPGPRIYIPPEQGGPVISPSTGLSFPVSEGYGSMILLISVRWHNHHEVLNETRISPPLFVKSISNKKILARGGGG